MSKVKDYHDNAMEEIFRELDKSADELIDELKRLQFELDQKDKYIEHLERALKANTRPL